MMPARQRKEFRKGVQDKARGEQGTCFTDEGGWMVRCCGLVLFLVGGAFCVPMKLTWLCGVAVGVGSVVGVLE